ncbi:protein translocase subunit SecDF [Flavipsychrobacter stenotrophus]|uniref:Multifunctional fusion protein n=1 Tax=Flavipsychrobacter stenotrophus TaxID=2077091 RepID=A0A2S7SZ97_9BACT|nr:protein translocase subunit SecDF [Flavipsychrobacter stenotrophus]PQJ11895.1 protein translocase subunit SecDF [Flavipsychrobacter stenotrophus]
MQLKGLVKFFTVALILFALYQLSITFVVRNEEKKMHAKAEREIKAQYPGVSEDSTRRLVDARYQAISDSMQDVEIFNVGIKKYTLASAKDEELKLGLDLQGGMNVTLEVSLDEMVRSMSNNPKDPALNKAIATATQQKGNSEANFITLFSEAYLAQNQGASLSTLFLKPSEKAITRTSTNQEVIKVLNEESKDAIKRTYNVLQTRIDKFGVSSPNVNLDEKKGIITVELAGVTNPERVRTYLQATAKLQFFETYTNEEIIGSLSMANDALARHLAGTDEDTAAKVGDTTATASTKSTDTTGGLGALMGKKDGKTDAAMGGKDSTSLKQAEAIAKNPLFALMNPYVDPQNGQAVAGSVVGLVAKKDTAKLNKYLAMESVKSKLPANVKLVYGADEKKNPVLMVYAVKVPPGGIAKLEGDNVTNARKDFNQLSGKQAVYMEMTLTGSHIWKEMTGRNVGKFIAVVLDDKVYSCPRVQGEIPSGGTEISGNFTNEQAGDLANILKSGKLPAPAHIVAEQVVGPTLGAENIDKGINSLALSFIVIFALMLIYYNTGGIVADISLILNLLFTIGILSMSSLHATLTMAGIAGLVLTIGMAVDTNVIIFERIKEELLSGKSYKDAVEEGYKRSYAPVFDGHITTLITAVILFIFGLGPVRGFATTQIIGILLSLFCGILVSRLITDIYTKRERHFNYFTGLSKSIFKKAHFKFVEARKYTYVISSIMFLVGISTYWHGFNKGVEFSGGRSYKVKFEKAYSTEDVKKKLKPYFLDYPAVKTIGTDKQLDITTGYMITDAGQNVDKQVEEKLFEGLTKENLIPSNTTMDEFKRKYLQQSTTVLPTISDDLKRGAWKATAISLFAIFIYILLRFRKWQYSLGTVLSLLHDIAVTLAIFSYFKGIVPFALEIDQHFIAAILTVCGFSMNDTVIVFDRIREYFRKSPNEDKVTVINRAINDTLSRTIMTSLTVFITLVILFFVGGEATKGFAFAMMIGVITGTYSSIFVAAPVLVDMDKSGSLKVESDAEARIEELKKLA